MNLKKLTLRGLTLAIFLTLSLLIYQRSHKNTQTPDNETRLENIQEIEPTLSPTTTDTITPTLSLGRDISMYGTPFEKIYPSIDQQEMWKTVNEERVNNGVGSLTENEILCATAEKAVNLIIEYKRLLTFDEFETIAPKGKFNNFQIGFGLFLPSQSFGIEQLSTNEETKSIFDGGQYIEGCLRSVDNSVVVIAAY